MSEKPKTLKQLLREKFGNKEVVARFYNLVQEKSTIEAIKVWLQQNIDFIRKDIVIEKNHCPFCEGKTQALNRVENELLEELEKKEKQNHEL